MNLSMTTGSQQGAIIVVTLVLLLVMTTMGVGLVYVTGSSSKQVAANVNRSESLHTSETCVEDMVRWLEKESVKGPPCKSAGTSRVCNRIRNKNMDEWRMSTEGSKNRAKMRKHLQMCDLHLLTTVASQGSGGAGTGFDVGQSGGYGGAKTSTKYLYRVVSTGRGPDHSRVDIEVILSMIF